MNEESRQQQIKRLLADNTAMYAALKTIALMHTVSFATDAIHLAQETLQKLEQGHDAR